MLRHVIWNVERFEFRMSNIESVECRVSNVDFLSFEYIEVTITLSYKQRQQRIWPK